MEMISRADKAGEAGARPAFLSRLPIARDRPLTGYLFAALSIAVAAAVRFAVADWLPPGFPFVTFFPAVIITSFLFGTGPGIVAGMSSLFVAWYFFVEPERSFELGPGAAVALGFYLLVISVQILSVHLMQVANRRLVVERERVLALARHGEILFSELQHRVGNNLQMAASMLQLQKRKLDSDQARTALDEASRRLGMIGRVQRQLYDPSGAQLALDAFLEQLARDVIETSGNGRVTLKMEAELGLSLKPDAAIPTALIVAEALANALEHGFSGRDEGEIVITLSRTEDRLKIEIVDDGSGLDPSFAGGSDGSLGLRLCQLLAQGLRGTFEVTPSARGTCARLIQPYA